MAGQQLERLSYSVAEAQQVSGLGETSILNAIKRGDLKAVKIGRDGIGGRKFLISAASLRAFVDPDIPKIAEIAEPRA